MYAYTYLFWRTFWIRCSNVHNALWKRSSYARVSIKRSLNALRAFVICSDLHTIRQITLKERRKVERIGHFYKRSRHIVQRSYSVPTNVNNTLPDFKQTLVKMRSIVLHVCSSPNVTRTFVVCAEYMVGLIFRLKDWFFLILGLLSIPGDISKCQV